MDTVHCLKEGLRNPAGYESSRATILSQLIDGKDTVANKFCLGGSEVWENETRAIAEDNLVAEMDRLEMLCLARRC